MERVLVFLLLQFALCSGTQFDTNIDNGGSDETKVLSRAKRFLTFPEGSSLQLVFCCQTPVLAPIGDILLYSNTAALAWNLPEDLDWYHKLKQVAGYEKDQNRRSGQKYIYYLGENGELLDKVPYKRRPIVNPAFAKRSIDGSRSPDQAYDGNIRMEINKTKMHEAQSHRKYLDAEETGRAGFHRSSRVGLFQKLEVLFTLAGQTDGRQCILRQLCESKQAPKEQGTFLQELLRVVFTLPKGEDFKLSHHQEYDKAHQSNEDCQKLYPKCDGFQLFNRVIKT